MVKNIKGQILIVTVCLFFVLGIFIGCKIGGLYKGEAIAEYFLKEVKFGGDISFWKTFFKEFKYIIFLWIAGGLVKSTKGIMAAVGIKGFFVGFTSFCFVMEAEIKGIFLYVLPCQVFSSAAVILSAAIFLYNKKTKMCLCHMPKMLIFQCFLIFLGIGAEGLILKII